MVEVVRAAKREPIDLADRLSRVLGGLNQRRTAIVVTDYLIPIGMALLFLVSLLLVVDRATTLRGWDEAFQGSGTFLVERCEGKGAFGGDQWSCSGRLSTPFHDDGPGRLVASRGAMTSDRPYVGERFDIFHRTGDATAVYPLDARLNEMARVYLSLIPRLLVVIGSLIWLAGWAFTRNLTQTDFVTRDSIRLPQRFGWRAKGLTWLGVAVAMVVVNHLLATRVIGSLHLV